MAAAEVLPIATIEYRARPGGVVSQKAAQAVGEALAELEEHKGATPQPEEVVQAAEDPTSSLHPLFNWDDGQAAYQYRLTQARRVLKSVVLVWVGPLPSTEPIRTIVVLEPPQETELPAFTHLRIGYRRTDKVLADKDERAEAMRSIVRRLYGFYGELNLYPELQGLARAILGAYLKHGQ